MRAIPVDAAALSAVTAMGAPVPLANPDTGERKANRDGVPLFSVEVAVAVATAGGEAASVLRVKVAAAEAPRVRAGMPVVLVGLVATPWEIGGKHGVAFSAAAIRPAAPPTPPAGPAKG